MAIPGDTPSPVNLCSAVLPASVSPASSSILIELAFDQLGQRRDRLRGLRPAGAQLDRRARGRGQHHQPHDRAAGDLSTVLAHPDIGLELRRRLDKAGRGARVQPALVADRRDPSHDFRRGTGAGVAGRVNPRAGSRTVVHRQASVSNCEATLMYLRPASCAPSTVRSRLSLCRKLTSLISIGRLTPAMTSILARSMTDIARFEGVPPNMSVNSTAPSPLST